MPFSNVNFAPVAQLEERLRPKEKVTGSIPVGGAHLLSVWRFEP